MATPGAAAAGYCTVYCKVQTQEGVVPSGTFWVRDVTAPEVVEGVDVVFGPDECAIAGDGYAAVTLLQGATVSLRLRTDDVERERAGMLVPESTGPVNWNDLVAEA